MRMTYICLLPSLSMSEDFGLLQFLKLNEGVASSGDPTSRTTRSRTPNFGCCSRRGLLITPAGLAGLKLGAARAAKLQRDGLPNLIEGVHDLLLCEVGVRLGGAYPVGRDLNLIDPQRDRHAEEARQLLDRLRVACVRPVLEQVTLLLSDRVGVQWHHQFSRGEPLYQFVSRLVNNLLDLPLVVTKSRPSLTQLPRILPFDPDKRVELLIPPRPLRLLLELALHEFEFAVYLVEHLLLLD